MNRERKYWLKRAKLHTAKAKAARAEAKRYTRKALK